MQWYERLIMAHLAVTDQVSHAQRMSSDRYFVWQEEGSTDLIADGKHKEKVFSGTTDLFTKQEFDPWKEALEQSFDESEISWELSSVQFEEDTGFWHYEWLWQVVK